MIAEQKKKLSIHTQKKKEDMLGAFQEVMKIKAGKLDVNF
jgi:hypothetical protein